MQESETKLVLEVLLKMGLVEVSINPSGQMQYFLTEDGLQEMELIQNLLGPVEIV